MKPKQSLYSYEKTAEIAHLLPMRNSSHRHIKGTASHKVIKCSIESVEQLNRSTDYTANGFYKKAFNKAQDNQNRLSWQGTPQINQSITEINSGHDRQSANNSRYGNRVEYGGVEFSDVNEVPNPSKLKDKFQTIQQCQSLSQGANNPLTLSPSLLSLHQDSHQHQSSPSQNQWYTRMMRHSSRDWETDPRFMQQLFRYNQVDHVHYNPGLESKSFRQAYKNTLNVSVPIFQQVYSKSKASTVNYKIMAQDELLAAQLKKEALKKQNNHEIDPEVIYFRFVKDLNQMKAKQDTRQKQQMKDKLQHLVEEFQHKVYRTPIFKISKPLTSLHNDDILESAKNQNQDPQSLVKEPPKTKFQLLIQNRIKEKQEKELSYILEAKRLEEEALRLQQLEEQGHHHHRLSNKEVDELVEQLLNEERERQSMLEQQQQRKKLSSPQRQQPKGTTTKITRMAQSVIEEMPSAALWSQISSSQVDMVGGNDYQQRSMHDSSQVGVRMSWQLKRLGSEESGRKKKIVNIKLKQQRMMQQIIKQPQKMIKSSFRKSVDDKSHLNEASFFTQNKSTVGSSTGYKDVQISNQLQINNHSMSTEFDEKRLAVSRLMKDCTDKLNHKKTQMQTLEIEKLRDISDSQLSLAHVITEYQDRDKKQDDQVGVTPPSYQLKTNRPFIGIFQYLEQKNTQEQCDEDNFLSKDVIRKIKNDNMQLSGKVQLLKKVSKNSQNGKKKLWKPNPLILSNGIGEL